MGHGTAKGGARRNAKGTALLAGKSNECTERAANSVEDLGDEDASVSPIGGVWMIAAVESREGHDEGLQMVSGGVWRCRIVPGLAMMETDS